MFSFRYCICFFFCFLCTVSRAQIMDIEEKKPVVVNGIEFGYIIKNEQTKSVSKEEYARFEITLYATNKSGCTRLFAEKPSEPETQNVLAIFNCINANGKRLTSKNGHVQVKDFIVQVKVNDKTTGAKAGYILRNGETIKDNIIVLLPLNERPKIQCTINYLPELQ